MASDQDLAAALAAADAVVGGGVPVNLSAGDSNMDGSDGPLAAAAAGVDVDGGKTDDVDGEPVFDMTTRDAIDKFFKMLKVDKVSYVPAATGYNVFFGGARLRFDAAGVEENALRIPFAPDGNMGSRRGFKASIGMQFKVVMDYINTSFFNYLTENWKTIFPADNPMHGMTPEEIAKISAASTTPLKRMSRKTQAAKKIPDTDVWSWEIKLNKEGTDNTSVVDAVVDRGHGSVFYEKAGQSAILPRTYLTSMDWTPQALIGGTVIRFTATCRRMTVDHTIKGAFGSTSVAPSASTASAYAARGVVGISSDARSGAADYFAEQQALAQAAIAQRKAAAAGVDGTAGGGGAGFGGGAPPANFGGPAPSGYGGGGGGYGAPPGASMGGGYGAPHGGGMGGGYGVPHGGGMGGFGGGVPPTGAGGFGGGAPITGAGGFGGGAPTTGAGGFGAAPLGSTTRM